jgi:hypothetical protein
MKTPLDRFVALPRITPMTLLPSPGRLQAQALEAATNRRFAKFAEFAPAAHLARGMGRVVPPGVSAALDTEAIGRVKARAAASYARVARLLARG